MVNKEQLIFWKFVISAACSLNDNFAHKSTFLKVLIIIGGDNRCRINNNNNIVIEFVPVLLFFYHRK